MSTDLPQFTIEQASEVLLLLTEPHEAYLVEGDDPTQFLMNIDVDDEFTLQVAFDHGRFEYDLRDTPGELLSLCKVCQQAEFVLRSAADKGWLELP